MVTNSLENFHILLVTKFFQHFQRRPTGLFGYSRVGVLFPICSKITTNLLENYQAKKIIVSKKIFSMAYHFIFDCIADYMKRPLEPFFAYSIVLMDQEYCIHGPRVFLIYLVANQVALFKGILLIS